jgi:hypothetical protein
MFTWFPSVEPTGQYIANQVRVANPKPSRDNPDQLIGRTVTVRWIITLAAAGILLLQVSVVSYPL